MCIRDRDETIEKAKALGGQFDLVVYSLASPRRTDPSDGQSYRACLKPVGAVYKNQTLDTDKGEVKEISIDPASEEDVLHTRKVMGGRTGKLGRKPCWLPTYWLPVPLMSHILTSDRKSLGPFTGMARLGERRNISSKRPANLCL